MSVYVRVYVSVCYERVSVWLHFCVCSCACVCLIQYNSCVYVLYGSV